MHEEVDEGEAMWRWMKVADDVRTGVYMFYYLGHGGCSWSGPNPKGGGGRSTDPEWLHGTMCFVGTRGTGDFVLGTRYG